MNRSASSKVKLGVHRAWTSVLAWSLLTAGALQAQSEPGPFPTPTPPPPLAAPAEAQREPGPAALGPPAQVSPASATAATPPAPVNPVSANTIVDTNVVPASGCASGHCGGGCAGGGCQGNPASAYGYSGGGCVPGKRCCDWVYNDTICGRFLGGIYEGVCCPDPCYEPSWIFEANAAFFQDGARPVTQTRIRWDAGRDYAFPDTAEFLWARIGQKGPSTPTASLNYNSLSLYQEVAAKGASFFIEVPYLNMDPSTGSTTAGMGDMNLGVKTVLLDRELILISTQLRTFIPIGNPTDGLGTGHVSLEPAILSSLKLASHTYLQMELADWIPFGGTPGFAGSVFHYHFALDQNLYQAGNFLSVVGTLELNGYSFRGAFTDLTKTAVGMDGASYLNLGPGLRVMICDHVDIGVGMGFDLNSGHGPAQIYRSELRIRF